MIRMNDTAKCPYCNIDLEFEDVSEQTFNINHYVDQCIGYCPQCNKVFRWEEIFERIGVKNIREEME